MFTPPRQTGRHAGEARNVSSRYVHTEHNSLHLIDICHCSFHLCVYTSHIYKLRQTKYEGKRCLLCVDTCLCLCTWMLAHVGIRAPCCRCRSGHHWRWWCLRAIRSKVIFHRESYQLTNQIVPEFSPSMEESLANSFWIIKHYICTSTCKQTLPCILTAPHPPPPPLSVHPCSFSQVPYKHLLADPRG